MKPYCSLIITLSLLLNSLQAAHVTVTIENLAPPHGTYLTPAFAGFHDGTFDLFDSGAVASAALERMAEDGNSEPLITAFMTSGASSVGATIIGQGAIPPFAPGDLGSMTFWLDPADPASRYFSFLTMVIPSNDAFIGNGNPVAVEVFDANGNFLAKDFMVHGTMVWDAGTEVNDEVPQNTAFLAQTSPDTGGIEGGTVALHAGFLPAGSGGILDNPMFAAADFTEPGYMMARVTISLADSDGDGVVDDSDQCPDTAPGEAVDTEGCSIAQVVPCEGPAPGVAWRNHGQYVHTVGDVVREFVYAGLLPQSEGLRTIIAAVQSDCGQVTKPKKPKKVKSKKSQKSKKAKKSKKSKKTKKDKH